MKRRPFFTVVLSAALAACIGLGVTGAMVTGFGLTLERPWQPPAVCLLACLLGGIVFQWKKGGWYVAAAAALAGGFLWWQGDFLPQLFQLLYRISYIYNRAYHFGYLQLVEGAWDDGFADLPMAVLGAAAALSVARCVCRGKGLALPGLAVLPPLAACFVVTDTVPSSASLFAVLLGFSVLLVTSLTRTSDTPQGNLLAAHLLLPMAAALGLLFLAVPQESYVNQSAQVLDRLAGLLRPYAAPVELPQEMNAWSAPVETPEQVDLAGLDGQPESDTPVMTVLADVGGSLYLRGQDYDVYTGLGWESSPYRAEDFSRDGENLGVVTVQTEAPMDRLYLPYYPQQGISLVGGRVENTSLYTTYHFRRSGLSEELYTLPEQPEPDRTPKEEYLALPETTRAFAQTLLEEILTDRSSATRQAEAIGVYLRQKAVYDRRTPRMPQNETDFARWFLTDSDRGFCVHFATAAVVLLRAAGIEARYVSGYLVKAPSGETTTVTVSNAHAWAEYYEPRLGLWLTLEATASSGGSTLPAAQEGIPPAASEPPAPATVPVPADPTQPAPDSNASTLPTAPPVPSDAAKDVPLALLWLLGAAALAGLLEGQRALRRAGRAHRQQTGRSNAQAIARWQEVRRLCRALGEEPPNGLEVLTGKAKFSQHTLSPAELSRYDDFLRQARSRLKKNGPLRWLYGRYILAVI